MPYRVGGELMTEEFRPARRAGRRRVPEVRCRSAVPPSVPPPTPPSVPSAGTPARSTGTTADEPKTELDLELDAWLSDSELEVIPTVVRGDTAVVEVKGEIDLRTADALRARLVEVHASGPLRLVVDFTAVPFCDAAGLGALVAAHNQIAAGGGEIVLAGLRPAQRRLLYITGLHRLFPVHENVSGALAAHDSPTTPG